MVLTCLAVVLTADPMSASASCTVIAINNDHYDLGLFGTATTSTAARTLVTAGHTVPQN